MAHLKYYKDERVEFSAEFSERLSTADATLFFEKLKAHYKFRHFLKFGGRANNCNILRVQLKRRVDGYSLGILVHEVAHALQFKRLHYTQPSGFRFHTKSHTALMEKVFAYVQAHRSEWEFKELKKQEAIIKRHELKEQRQKELKALKETDAFKVEQLVKRQKKLLTRKKRLETSLKKIAKSLRYYEKKRLVPQLEQPIEVDAK